MKNQNLKQKNRIGLIGIKKLYLLCLLLCVGNNVLRASGSLLAQTSISLKTEEMDVETLFSEIEEQTDFVVLYKEGVPLTANVSVNIQNRDVESVLDEALSPIGLDYHVNGNQIIVARSVQKSREADSAAAEPLVKRKKVSGTLVDITGEPIIGASVMIKGGTTGTVTDLNGFYVLEVPDDAVLIYSYVGLLKQEISVKRKTVINLTMQEDSQVMNEVVVVGFGTQKKVNLTGAVTSVNAEVLEDRPVANAVQALQGAVPGLNITTNDTGGALDGNQTMRIRGDKQGIGDGDDGPLVLIDGMEGSLFTLNPQDIDNVSVLKDAASSAIYGARAANGVILVTTKSGKSGKATVSYNNNFRFNTPLNMPEMANSYEYVSFINDANYNGKGTAYYNAEHVQNILDYMNGTLIDPATGYFNPNYTMGIEDGTYKWYTKEAWANEDWLNEYYKDWANSQEHNLSVSGGNESVTYYLSANYQNQNGFLRHGKEDRQRYSVTGKLSAKVNKMLKVDFSSRFSRIDYDKPSRLNNTFFNEVLRRAIPFQPAVSPDGQTQGFIPILEEGGQTQTQNEELYMQLKATFTPIKNLNVIGEMNARFRNNWGHAYWLPVYAHFANNPNETYLTYLSEKSQWANAIDSDGNPVGSVKEDASRNTYLAPNLYANYELSVGKHHIVPMMGVQLETYKQRSLSGQRYNLVSQDSPVLDLATSLNPNDIILGCAYGDWAVLGMFARINYDYDNRYLVELNGRMDASSRFRSKMRWITTPSVSVGWNIANERFFDSIEYYVPYLKLRASYGSLANQNTSNFYPTYQSMNFQVGNGLWLVDGLQPNTAGLPKPVSTLLTWERTETANIGLDWAFFNSRLSGSLDLYSKKMIGLMGSGVELPAVFGANAPSVNNTDLRTTGFELELSWKDMIKDFSYSVTFNLSDDKTRVLKYPNPTGSLSKCVEGELLGNIYGYTTKGIAQSHDEMLAHLEMLRDRRIEQGLPLLGADGLGGQSDGGLGRGLTAGDVMYEDINGDGSIDTGDNTIYNMGDYSVIGNTSPRFHTALRLDMAWKGVDLSLFFQGVLKRDYYPDDPGGGSGQDLDMLFWGATRGGVAFSTVFKEHLDYWRDETSPLGANYDAYYPRPLFNLRNQKPQTRYLQDASYLRLKNIQLGYTLPQKWTKTIGIERFRIFGTAENLLTFTKMTKLLDPEVAGYGQKGGMVYPLSKTFAFGINVNF